MSFLKKKNCARTTLANGITAVATTMVVTDATELPSTTDFVVTIWNKNIYSDPCNDPNMEIVKITNIAGNTLTIVRGQENTSASAHSGGHAVEQLITAGQFEEIEQAIDNFVDSDNQDANEVPFTPDGDIVSTDVQTAIQEVRDDTDIKLSGKSDTGHTHVALDITDFDTEVSNNTDVSANTADRHTHANKIELDLISDGDHDIRIDNPHGVTKNQVGLSSVTNDAQLKRSASDFSTFTDKATPVDADITLIEDSAMAGGKKKLSWANIKATLKTYFDTLYNLYTHPNHTGDVTSVADGAQTITNNVVTNAKIVDMATKTYKGRTTAGTGDPEDVPVATLKTDLALNNVTNDSQLKRSLGDFNTFTEKTVPVSDDILLIEDSAVTFSKKKIKISNLPSSSIYGSQYQYVNSASVSSTSSSGYQTKLTLTTGSLPSGTYLISYSAEFTNSSSGSATDVEARHDTTQIAFNCASPDTEDDIYKAFSGFYQTGTISGVQTFDIRYRAPDGGTARTRRARLVLWRVS